MQKSTLINWDPLKWWGFAPSVKMQRAVLALWKQKSEESELSKEM